MTLLADDGADPEARQRVLALAKGWLANPKSVPESMWGAVLTSALRANPKEMFAALAERVGKEPNRATQRTIYATLAQVRDRELQAKAFAMALEGEPMTSERISVLRVGPDTFALQGARFDFLKAHKDELLKRLPRDHRGAVVATVCDASRRDEVAAYLDSLVSVPEIGELAIKQAIEGMDLCIARRAEQEPALAKYLTRK